jgi:hypothetical protein
MSHGFRQIRDHPVDLLADIVHIPVQVDHLPELIVVPR